MTRRVNVEFHMLVFGGVTAPNITANHAHAQVGPGVAYVQTFLAFVSGGFPDLDQVEMRAGFFLELARVDEFEEKFRNTDAGRSFDHTHQENAGTTRSRLGGGYRVAKVGRCSRPSTRISPVWIATVGSCIPLKVFM
jgi:hypothetical protein